MKGRVGAVGQDKLRPVAAEYVARGVKFRERCKCRIGASIAVGVVQPGETHPDSGHISGAQLEIG